MAHSISFTRTQSDRPGALHSVSVHAGHTTAFTSKRCQKTLVGHGHAFIPTVILCHCRCTDTVHGYVYQDERLLMMPSFHGPCVLDALSSRVADTAQCVGAVGWRYAEHVCIVAGSTQACFSRDLNSKTDTDCMSAPCAVEHMYQSRDDCLHHRNPLTRYRLKIASVAHARLSETSTC